MLKNLLQYVASHAMSGASSRKPKGVSQKQNSEYGWRLSPRSEHFGQRKKPVIAYTPKGLRTMACKNAVKKGYQIHERP